jgi:hypothetical protein
MSSLSSLRTDRNSIIEKGAILTLTMHCVTLLVRGRVLFDGFSQRMLNQKSVTGMEYTVTVMVAGNCTVCHLQEALFFNGEIAFFANSVKEILLFHCNTVQTTE